MDQDQGPDQGRVPGDLAAAEPEALAEAAAEAACGRAEAEAGGPAADVVKLYINFAVTKTNDRKHFPRPGFTRSPLTRGLHRKEGDTSIYARGLPRSSFNLSGPRRMDASLPLWGVAQQLLGRSQRSLSPLAPLF